MTESNQETKPLVSVVIPVRNQGDHLAALLASLQRYAPSHIPHETIVVDDGSSEDHTAILGHYDVDLYRTPGRRGPACARNVGVSHARGDVILFLDADVVYAPEVMEKAVALLADDSDVAAVSFLNQRYGKDDAPVANFGAAMAYHMSSAAIPAGQDLAPVSLFSTRSGALRRDAFTAIGGFDERYQTNVHEDIEFSRRLANQFKCVGVRQPTVDHSCAPHIRRVFRNYFLRTWHFVAYFIGSKAELDRVVLSKREAGIRLVGFASLVCLSLAILPVPLKGLWMATGASALTIYVLAILGFLRQVRRWSGTMRFVLFCFVMHYVCAQVIVLGGLCGLVSALLKRETAYPPDNAHHT